MKRGLALLLLVITVLGTTACDSFISNFNDWIDETVVYKYTVELEYGNNADKAVMNKRLPALGFSIVSEENNIYQLECGYIVPEDFFDFASKNYDYKLLDENGEIYLTAEEVTSIKCYDITIRLKVSEDTYKRLDESMYSQVLTIEGFTVTPLGYEDDGEFFIELMIDDSDDDYESLNDAEKALFAYAISLSETEITGEIKGTVTPIEPAD